MFKRRGAIKLKQHAQRIRPTLPHQQVLFLVLPLLTAVVPLFSALIWDEHREKQEDSFVLRALLNVQRCRAKPRLLRSLASGQKVTE